MQPFSHAGGLPPVIAHHGLNLDAGSLTLIGTVEVLQTLADAGHMVGLPSSNSGWGNAASLALADSCDSWMQANGAANVKRGLVGWSHGACMSVMQAKVDPSKIAWMVLGIPALDLQYLRVQNTVEGIGFRSSIDFAKGVTYPAALPANSSPMDHAAALSSIPVLMFTCSDDDISTNCSAWAATHGNTTLVNLGALGHTLAALEAIVALKADILAFANTHRVG
jgi:hypothetical protein